MPEIGATVTGLTKVRNPPRADLRTGEGVELVQLRWGFPPARPKAAPVINFRSEGRRFPKGRCLIPASHFFEFTGARPPKSKWKFTETR
jgi:putative SOS response-associated peptidase YedK